MNDASKHLVQTTLLCCCMINSGCCVNGDRTTEQAISVMPILRAFYTDEPIQVDGQLNEPIWERATEYPLEPFPDRAGERVKEKGTIRLLWNKHYLYLAARLDDSDVVAEGDQDQMPHYLLGDVLELFLKSTSQTWYWELYVTPRGCKSSLFLPGPGRIGLPSNYDYECDLAVGAVTMGTLNEWQDRDHSWTAEMSIPIAALTAYRDSFGPDSEWRILIGRYNYSRFLPDKELSSQPRLQSKSFHSVHEYAKLQLLPTIRKSTLEQAIGD